MHACSFNHVTVYHMFVRSCMYYASHRLQIAMCKHVLQICVLVKERTIFLLIFLKLHYISQMCALAGPCWHDIFNLIIPILF